MPDWQNKLLLEIRNTNTEELYGTKVAKSIGKKVRRCEGVSDEEGEERVKVRR